MSVSELCQICEAREARFTCDNCGAVVCEDHYDDDVGFCLNCARTARGGGDVAEGADDVVEGSEDVADGADDVVDDGTGTGSTDD